MSRSAVVLFLVLPVLAACGGGGDEPVAEQTASGPEAPVPEAGAAITATDSGREFALAPGGETSLRLSSEYLWSEPVVEGDAIELSPVDYLQDPGFTEWLVRGLRPGTATISSLG
jgi:hypothetical protein